MSSLSTTHKEYVLEQLMLDYLHQGIIPTSDQLAADLAAYMVSHPNLNEPTSKVKDWSVKQGDHSSAEQIHDVADTLSQDVGIITREMYRIAQASSRFYDRWTNEMKRLSAYARKLEQRTDSLLLLNADTVGFFAYVGDVFADMNRVDTTETDAKIDLHETSVTINPAVTELSAPGSLIDLSHMTESNISFQVLTKTPGVAYMTTGEGNKISNIFQTVNSTWVGQVVSEHGGEMICELKAKLGDQDYEVSKIVMEFSGPLGVSSSTVTGMYSADGYTWYLLPSSSPTKTMASSVSWLFPLTTMRWIKFIFHKPAPDSADNSYVFSISYVKLYGNEYDESVGGTFVTTALQALNAAGTPIKFSLLALDVCQETPDGTGIDYSVSASKDGTTWTDWMLISASDSSAVLYPKVINLSGADWKSNEDIANVTLLDETAGATDPTQRKVTRIFSNSTYLTHLLGYRFKGGNYGVVNTAIPVSTGEDPDPISGSVVMWRNVRYKNTLDYPDVSTVRGTVRGWGFNGGEYSCYFEVISSDGKVIDFGDRKCIVDGQEVSGVVTIPMGIHKFTTKADNWHDIANGYIALGSVASQEELASIDPLYPYNHKLLIDGFPYPVGDAYQGDRVYTGTDISAEFYAVKASLFDLENNLLGDDQYGYFSVRSVGDETYPTLAAVVRFDTNNSDYTNELFTIKWRSGAADSSMYSYVKLKAQLWTTDTGISPSLSSYRVKLGV